MGEHSWRSIGLVALAVALAGCAAAPPGGDLASACAAKGETSYECQVERYNNVNAD